MTSPVPTVQLTHGARMPMLGFGTWPMDDAEAERVVADAIGAGYRMIDTAENYGNEQGVGRAVRAAGVPREDLFVTTKFNKQWHSVDGPAQAFANSARRLGVDYLDLLLIHWPNPQHDRYAEAWEGLARLLEAGDVRAIGMSNFRPHHLERVIEHTGVVPDVNQIQLSPTISQTPTRTFDAEHGIATQSWSPLGGNRNDVLALPLVGELAERHQRTPAQIVLRWHLELGLVPVPKSSDPQRLRANLEVFDFRLDAEEIAQLSALDDGTADAANPESFGH